MNDTQKRQLLAHMGITTWQRQAWLCSEDQEPTSSEPEYDQDPAAETVAKTSQKL